MLYIHNLDIGYSKGDRRKAVLSSLNFIARENELIALIGRNGIGKTTLLKTLTGILSPINGSVEIYAMDLQQMNRKDLAKLVSYVSTDMVHSATMTVYDLVSLGRYPHTSWYGQLEETDRFYIAKAIEYTHLDPLTNKYLSELSDGERQRAMIARALAQDTKIIIMDEPAAFLDLVNRYEAMHMLRRLCREEGKTVIFSTHDLTMALHEADKAWLLLPQGCIEGAPEDIILRGKLNDLFNESKMNFNEESGEISLRHDMQGNIKVVGEGNVALWTRKALERMGYRAIISGQELFTILISSNKDALPIWTLQIYGQEYITQSIYELSLLIRNITANKPN